MVRVSNFFIVFICLWQQVIAFDYVHFVPAQSEFKDNLTICEQSWRTAVKSSQSLEQASVALNNCTMTLLEKTLHAYDLTTQLKYNFYVYSYFVEYHGFVCTDEIRSTFPCLSQLLLRWEQDLKNEELPPLR